MSAICITAINTFPVKGLSTCRHEAIQLSAGAMLPFDQAWAIETGARKFDPTQPAWLPKISFAQLMSHEKLAQLETVFDAAGGRAVLTILRDGKQVARGDLATPIDRQLIEQFMQASWDLTCVAVRR